MTEQIIGLESPRSIYNRQPGRRAGSETGEIRYQNSTYRVTRAAGANSWKFAPGSDRPAKKPSIRRTRGAE